MSNGRLNIDLDIEGLELLSDALQNAPETVTREAERAGRQALPIIRDSIGDETPWRTGFLFRSEGTSLEGPFNIVFTASADYAQIVNARQGFVERGFGLVEGEVELLYESALDRVAATFRRGR